jgi:CBS domain-containing protein
MQGQINPVVFRKDIHSVSRGATVKEAVGRMVDAQVGSVLVMDGKHPIGIFTERDVVRRVVHAGLDPATTTVDQVMTAEVKTITPETPIEEALSLMNEGRFRHLPVMRDGLLLGMATVGDLSTEVTRNNEHLIGYITGTSYR